MPLIKAQGRKKKGGAPGGGAFLVKSLLNGNYDWSVSEVPLPVPGYVGPMDIILMGAGSNPGIYYSPDQKGGTQGSGQLMHVTYQAAGDERGYIIEQIGAGTSTGRLVLTIKGGVNEGKILTAGSRRNSNGYGGAGAAINFNGPTYVTIPCVVNISASCRPFDETLYYSDTTSYQPAAPASYGPGLTVKNYANNTRSVRMAGSAIPGGLVLESGTGQSLGQWGSSLCTSPYGYDTATSPGCIIFAYPN